LCRWTQFYTINDVQTSKKIMHLCYQMALMVIHPST